MRGSNEDINDLDVSLPAVKTLHGIEERLDTLQRLYIIEAQRFKRQM